MTTPRLRTRLFRIFFTLSASLAFGAASLLQATPIPDAKPRLIETGEFHDGEVQVRTGETWLGLFVSPKSSELAEVRVKISPVRDAEKSNSGRSDQEVTVSDPRVPVFLVKNCPSLQPSRVQTVFSQNLQLSNQTDISLKLNDLTYRLHVRTADTSEGMFISNPDAQLILSLPGRKQVLYALKGHKTIQNPVWSLNWAGDIDGDGRLDLYVTVTDHYNIAEKRLYLSSPARGIRLVKNVASFTTTGC